MEQPLVSIISINFNQIQVTTELLESLRNISFRNFEIIIVENNKLRFYNRFEYNTKEDFIYYLLFTAEQLQLNPEEFPAILMGTVDEKDDLFKIAYKYVRHVSVLPKEAMLYNNDTGSKHFTLLNSL